MKSKPSAHKSGNTHRVSARPDTALGWGKGAQGSAVDVSSAVVPACRSGTAAGDVRAGGVAGSAQRCEDPGRDSGAGVRLVAVPGTPSAGSLSLRGGRRTASALV